MVKISKRVYFGNIKVHFLDTLARPVDLTVLIYQVLTSNQMRGKMAAVY